MLGDDGIGHGQEVPVWAITAFDLGLAAQARYPFVGAGRGVSRLATLGIAPALGEDIVASSEQRVEQSDLGGGGRCAGHAGRWRSFGIRGATGGFAGAEAGEPGFKVGAFGIQSRQPSHDRGDFVRLG